MNKTNYEMILDRRNALTGYSANECHTGTATWCDGEAKRLYQKRLDAHVDRIAGRSEPSMVEWLFSEADTALEFDIGEFVKVAVATRPVDDSPVYVYGIVDRYKQLACNSYPLTMLRIKTADGAHVYDAPRVQKADLPKEILDLVKSQLAGKCPLKQQQCMKEND